MKKNILIILLATLIQIGDLSAQDDKQFEYHRSSLYSFCLVDPRTQFAEEIATVFKQAPLPDKYNDHNLQRKIIDSRYCLFGKKSKELETDMTTFVNEFKLGNMMIEKWFNMDKTTGNSNLDLIRARGFYDASALDVKIANMSMRGKAMLEDAGEELIGKTFVVANYIRYNDKKETASVFHSLGQIASSVGSLAGVDGLEAVGDLTANITENWDGFKVIVETYLFQVDWNSENAALFYEKYYKTDGSGGYKNVKDFEKDTLFRLKLVGSTKVSSGKTAVFGTNDRVSFMRKVCTRAVDKSIAQLQREYEVFKIKTPIVSVDPITAYIGMKEDVTTDTKFEVLEAVEDEFGHTQYRRVGVVKPKKGKIWDNRYMAVEEGAEGAELGYTTFTRESGDIYPGMLLRQIK